LLFKLTGGVDVGEIRTYVKSVCISFACAALMVIFFVFGGEWLTSYRFCIKNYLGGEAYVQEVKRGH
jgi:hypothetical protein